MTKGQKKALKELLIEVIGEDLGRLKLHEVAAKMRGVSGFFTDDGYARAQQEYEERLTSKVVREIERDGVPVYCHVTNTDEQGNVTHEYVQMPLLDVEQFKQAADYRVKMALRHIRVLKALMQECKAVHRRKLPVQLSLIERELRELKPIARAERAQSPQQPKEDRRPSGPDINLQ